MFGYIKKLLDSTDATASLRHFSFLIVVAFGVLALGAEEIVGLIKHGTGITSEWNFGFLTLTGAATGSKIAGAIRGKGNDAATSEAPKE
jgi:hypothetical protein